MKASNQVTRSTDPFKLIFVTAVILATFTMLSFFSSPFSFMLENFSYGRVIPIVTLFLSVFMFAFLYLQSGGARVDAKSSRAHIDTKDVRGMFDELNLHRQEAAKKIEILNKKIDELDALKGLSEAERCAVIEDIIKHSGAEAIKGIFESEVSRLKAELVDGLGLERLTSFSRSSVERLKREISDLRLRSNINLLIGMLITAGGLWLLWSTVSMLDTSTLLKALASEGEESNVKFYKNLVLPVIPRVMLVVFVEVFAYFFLRLYRNGLSEIKYFQNELTNIESKLTAAEFAYVTKNEDALKFSIESLSKTERNFVLEKGQTTVELERAKAESQLSKDLIKIIPNLFERKQ
ncbi:hypothetical protein [Pseudomonas fragi]|uniref:hypothetical protein n=1 Tax=Pseudomonas fragi TaxID=296 RepID=UPI00030CB37D|nr:hypothetical protein [Pseudomonas fragi]MDE4515143.1 hypothetical protein [Pseudomonas fragi]QPC37556.1 hypothetical protein IS178_10410 [Pseudomonas fragi]SDU14872.1 hypothetical protein SAMN05216594_1066 [Pseudomonas fragi]